MKKMSLTNLLNLLRTCIVIFVLAILCLFLFSFTINKLNADFLKELGISKTAADKKITESILGGYLNEYGAANAKNIIVSNRTAVANNLLNYVKQYVNSVAFKNDYSALKESNKPVENKFKTPEEMRKETVDAYKKSIAQTEEALKKADAKTKPVFENVLAESRKYLKDAEDPNNKTIAAYAKGYPELVKMNEESYGRELKKWGDEYPANQLLFVKQRLIQFLEETKEIDFNAELTQKGGKKVFVNSKYEGKSRHWKMAFRAGKEVVGPARVFVQQWIDEIK
jgi:hypothetical protein